MKGKYKKIYMMLGIVFLSIKVNAQHIDVTQYHPVAEVDSVRYNFVDYGDINNIQSAISANDYASYLSSAKKGDDESMRLVALCYLTGTGVEKDFNQAWKWLGKSAKSGNAQAEYDIATLYRDGYGVAQSYEESAYWFRKAASNGNVRAMVATGDQFLTGEGVDADNRIAAEYYWRAAERGDKEGAYKYAIMLKDGKGINKDIKKARQWLEVAGDYSDAKEQLQKLSVSSTPVQIKKNPRRWR